MERILVCVCVERDRQTDRKITSISILWSLGTSALQPTPSSHWLDIWPADVGTRLS